MSIRMASYSPGLTISKALTKLRTVGADRAARAVHLKDGLENFGVERVVLRAEEAHPAEHRGAVCLKCGVRAHAADGDLEIREEGDAGNGAHELEAEARIFQLAAAKNIARRLDLVLERCKLIKVRRQRPAVGVQKRFVVGDADGAVAHGQHIDPAVIGYVAQSRRGVVVHEIIARQVEKIAFIAHVARRIVGRAVNIGQLAGNAHHIGEVFSPL